MALCITCCDLFTRVDEDPLAFRVDEKVPFQQDQIPTTRHPRLIHLSWDSFCDSVDQNCPMCWAVWHEMRSSPIVSYGEETYQCFFTWLECAQGKRLFMDIFLPMKKKKRIILEVFRTTKKRFEAEARFLEGDLFSEGTFTTVKKWLDQCPETHQKCKSRKRLNPNPGTVPTRLLDTHGSKAKTWSLIETSLTNPASSDYVALSHRWSPDPKDTPRLKIENRSQYGDPQPDDVLPRTYQDVFALCRALDIRYIWIDSLCIIQDSHEDFEREVATMTKVYMNAVCTFSICWQYPNAGLSFYRKPNTYLCWSEAYTINMTTTDPKTHAFVRNDMDWRKAVWSAPVNTRGWVFQERLLSPRILYLGNDVLFWECDQFLASEIAPGRPYFSRKNIAAKTGDLARQWPDLVVEFMSKSLSYERDRLSAISGIAQLFAQRTSETFLAGLRKASWARDLLWYPRPFLPSHNRSPSGDFPSWSWAACPAPLDWPISDEMDMVRSILDDDFEPKVNTLANLSARSLEAFECDIYGKPGSASLDISCFLIPAQYEEFDGEIDEASSAHIERFQHPQYTRVKSHGFLFPTSHHRRDPSLITLPIDERNTDFSPSCFVLPLLDESESNVLEDSEGAVHGLREYDFFDLHALIVQERPRNSAGIEKTEQIGVREFIRIGTFTITLKGDYKDSPVWLNEWKAYRGILNGIWEQMRMHDSDESGDVEADEDMAFEKGLRQFVRARNNKLSQIVRGKMSEHQADVTVQGNWATIRLI